MRAFSSTVKPHSQKSTPSVQKQPAATPIPRWAPKQKEPVPVRVPASTKFPAAKSSPPTVISTPLPDNPTSPRTLPVEPTVIPSIEKGIEQSVASDVNPEQVSIPTPITAPPAPTASTQESRTTKRDAPTATERPGKRAKKTSEITRSKEWAQWQAPLTPASQNVTSAGETSETPRDSVASSSAVSSTPEPRRASTASKKRKPSKAAVDGDGSEKKKTRRRRREPTPEGAETVEILPNVIKMSELCKDLKTGKKSQREADIRKWEAEQQEKKHMTQENGNGAGTPKKSNGATAEPEPNASADKIDKALSSAEPTKQSGPVMRIVNGEIVLDASSLEVDRHADAARDVGELESVEENQFSRRVNQSTWGKRSKTEAWDEERTDLFYRGLRMFGTDFMVISKMFPGRSRHQIKLKFNNEERKDPQRIKDTLMGPREIIDIETYSEMTNATYDDPRIIQEQLDEEKKKIEEEHDKEKKMQEQLLRNTAETGGNAPKGEKDGNAPGKAKSRNVKKKPQPMGGGTEEVLGSI
ncbi:hypothetical protein N7468_000385 [Penicillium chermesinum]|uniref:Myb-like domain-containing protein n=1 Tax=Penicillium chermesinum TaxID=63820 RepID=A0A9W9PN71_9EURO|nr:uncharacterized protein N7468_000385 [Penicillium chermesinum]KAJ5248934.1 hypothetical protein N7468_000385 [Penicillium chermesinum]